jgi:hypothetical protein
MVNRQLAVSPSISLLHQSEQGILYSYRQTNEKMGITLISVGVSGARRWLIRRRRRPWWFACTLFLYHWTTQVGIPLETVHMDRTIVIDKTSTNSLQKHLTQTHNAPTSQFSFFAPPITSLHDMSHKIELETKGCPIFCIQWIALAPVQKN